MLLQNRQSYSICQMNIYFKNSLKRPAMPLKHRQMLRYRSILHKSKHYNFKYTLVVQIHWKPLKYFFHLNKNYFRRIVGLFSFHYFLLVIIIEAYPPLCPPCLPLFYWNDTPKDLKCFVRNSINGFHKQAFLRILISNLVPVVYIWSRVFWSISKHWHIS